MEYVDSGVVLLESSFFFCKDVIVVYVVELEKKYVIYSKLKLSIYKQRISSMT